ncbi:hypothetical protein C0Q92_15800 [Streptomyces albidoflavus]|uniref:Uncharacterized protein n=1 Tax=Streptomyces albidoflavus TaxID=1886 RepID=A0A8G2E097_9ACTN|nr:hypothetical protein SM8_016000 [Streptomyces sp. SM8]RZE22425.1 hypothetical protein C0Q92_15800 [Streptomyces albidoflavus]RZE26947.1 hypothetical protein C0Q96_15550 [Streptomyces albidoflavus]
MLPGGHEAAPAVLSRAGVVDEALLLGLTSAATATAALGPAPATPTAATRSGTVSGAVVGRPAAAPLGGPARLGAASVRAFLALGSERGGRRMRGATRRGTAA